MRGSQGDGRIVWRIFSLLIVCILLLPGAASFALAAGLEAKGQAPTPVTSTLSDQTELSLTIYNDNLGLVTDRRKIVLLHGVSEIRFTDVAVNVIPASVTLRAVPAQAGLRLLEQRYEYDLLSPQKLLEKYVGKELKLYQKNPYTEREEVVTATLLSVNNGPVFRIGTEITFGHPGRIIFPEMPEDLITRPTLAWLIEGESDGPLTIEATYLTGNLGWKADYVLTLTGKGDTANLAGFVTIDNRSGATYRDAAISLVAGDIHRVREEPEFGQRMMRMTEAVAAASKEQFREESFFEYHLYRLQRRATLHDNETKQILLVSAVDVPVKREFIHRGSSQYYLSRLPVPHAPQKVEVIVEMRNGEAQNLGVPLPKGIVRIYQADAEDRIQFAGEDSVGHTPAEEKIRLTVGAAFDVVVERRQTDWKKVASDTYEVAFDISLRNRRNEDIVVKVIEPFPGDWTLLSATHERRNTETLEAEFIIPVPKDKEATLSYRARIRF